MYGKRRCPVCKSVFTSGNQSRMYCSEKCKAIAHKKSAKKWKTHNKGYYRAWRKEHPDYWKDRKEKAEKNG